MRLATLGLATLGLALLAGLPALAAPGDEACQRELFMADAGVAGSYRALELAGSKPEEQCAGWRRQVEALDKAGAAYGRCAVGSLKARKTAEFKSTAADLRRLVSERCKGK